MIPCTKCGDWIPDGEVDWQTGEAVCESCKENKPESKKRKWNDEDDE